MKVIEITVPDDMVAVIVGLIAGDVHELHIRTVDSGRGMRPDMSHRTVHREKATLTEQIRSLIGARAVSGRDLEAFFQARGYAQGSALSGANTMSRSEPPQLTRIGKRGSYIYRLAPQSLEVVA